MKLSDYSRYNLTALRNAIDYYINGYDPKQRQYRDAERLANIPKDKEMTFIEEDMASVLVMDYMESNRDIDTEGLFHVTLPDSQWNTLFNDPRFKTHVLHDAIVTMFGVEKLFSYKDVGKAFAAYKFAEFLIKKHNLDARLGFQSLV